MTPPQRQRVMSPQTRTALGLPASAVVPEPRPADPPPTPGAGTPPALAITLRVQRRLAIRTMSVLLGGLLLGPLLVAVLPGIARLRMAGVPIVWIVLGGLAYPALLVLANHHRRAADRLEAELALRDTRV